MNEPVQSDDPSRVATSGADQLHEPGTEQPRALDAQQVPGRDDKQALAPAAEPNCDQPPERSADQPRELDAGQAQGPSAEQIQRAGADQPQEPGGDQPQEPGVNQPQEPTGQSHQPDAKAGGKHRCRRAGAKRLTAEQILRELDALNGAVAAGWIKPAAANAMSRIYQIKLACLKLGEGTQASGAVPNEILADLARRDPRALNVLAPFLTDEQFDDIVDSNLTDDEANDDIGSDDDVSDIEPEEDQPEQNTGTGD
jgi:hypothetical protein